MKATLTEVQRSTKNIFRHIAKGEAVTITDYGDEVAVIKPSAPRRVVSLAEFLTAEVTDEAIVLAVQASHL